MSFVSVHGPGRRVSASLRAMFLTFFFVAGAPLPGQGMPTDAKGQAAVRAAQSFMSRFEEGDLGNVYDQEMSPKFKALTARDTFLQNGGTIRIQTGGRALARELVGAQAFAQDPQGTKGDFEYVRFRARLPNGLVFQDVYLENIGGAWKVAGIFYLPAPQQ